MCYWQWFFGLPVQSLIQPSTLGKVSELMNHYVLDRKSLGCHLRLQTRQKYNTSAASRLPACEEWLLPPLFCLLIKLSTIWRKCEEHFSWFCNIIHETKGAIYNQEDKNDCKQQLSTPSLHLTIRSSYRSRVDSLPTLNWPTSTTSLSSCFGTVVLWCCWSNPASAGLTAVSGGKHCSWQRGGWPLLNYINLLFCGF